ncbi:MAG TPA: uracil-DNA glycosylase [Terriglobia bacterium]|nr:uracil-DNA glycosylase [Terriglobia bacterium]
MNIELPPSWQAVIGGEFDKPYFKSLAKFVDDEREAFPLKVYPSDNQVLAALRLTPYDKVHVLLLGQDPYPGEGMAHGLCFSVNPWVSKLPPSLRNMFRELQSDLGLPIPNNGCLAPWAAQGVLMLNTILTLRAGEPLSHKGRGWETFTDEIIRQVNARPDPVVFVLWGRPAQAKGKLIDRSRHPVVESAHPSPLSAKAFLGSKPFSRINAALRSAGKPEIDWEIPTMEKTDDILGKFFRMKSPSP